MIREVGTVAEEVLAGPRAAVRRVVDSAKAKARVIPTDDEGRRAFEYGVEYERRRRAKDEGEPRGRSRRRSRQPTGGGANEAAQAP